jgi:integrase
MISMPTVSRRKRKHKNRKEAYGAYIARIRIPADVADDYARLYKKDVEEQNLHISKSRDGVWREVQNRWPATNAPADVERKAAEWALLIKGQFKALRAARAGQLRSLSHRDIHALVGRWYLQFVSSYEQNPGAPESYWIALADVGDWLTNAAGIEGADKDQDALLADPTVLAIIRDNVARAANADVFLASQGAAGALTTGSRDAFLDALAPRYVDAMHLLQRRAKGDYGRDPIADTFPTLEPKSKPAVSIRALFDQWAADKQPAEGTIRKWSLIIDAANKQFPDVHRITEPQVREWFRSLVTAKRSAHTINNGYRTALKTLGNYAIREGVLKQNPFAVAKLTAPRKNKTRASKAFTDIEASTILRAALAIEIRTPLDAAKHWVPLIAAYTGARASELTALKGQDIGDDSIKLMAPKTRNVRTVPIHSHLLELGFVEWARSQGDGPLFYTPKTLKAKSLAHDVTQRIGDWVRKDVGVNDPEIAPIHSWRHTFKLIAERAGIPERLSDAITGHATASIGRSYGAPQLSDLQREMLKFPRYET